MKFCSGLLAGVLLTTAVSASAQSLGDLAKKEQERKKATPPAAKTYTNDDLKKLPPAPGCYRRSFGEAGRPEGQDRREGRDASRGGRENGRREGHDQAGGTREGRSVLARPRHDGARGDPPQRDVPRRAAGAHQLAHR